MSFFSGLLSSGGASLVKSIGDAADNLFTSDEERLELKNEMAKTESNYNLKTMEFQSKSNLAQTELIQLDIKSGSLFQSGWRPMIGWIGAAAMGYQFIVYPLLIWIWATLQAQSIVPAELSPPPVLDSSALFAIITGMLGVAGMRSYDKKFRTDTRS